MGAAPHLGVHLTTVVAIYATWGVVLSSSIVNQVRLYVAVYVLILL